MQFIGLISPNVVHVTIQNQYFPRHMTLFHFFAISELGWEGTVRFVDICGIVSHHCLEVIVCFVDIGEIANHHCLEGIACFVDIGGIVSHHCLEVIVFLLILVKLLTISV